MSVLALICARGGSKGIPGKNVRSIAGKPLIAWTVEAALRSHRVDSVVVSTDDDQIAEVARRHGAQTPFIRPGHLALDETPSIDVVLHALQALPGFKSVLLLQPTSPLRDTDDIDSCLKFAEDRSLKSVVSVTAADCHPHWTYSIDSAAKIHSFVKDAPAARRQDLPAAYVLNGAMYFAEATWLRDSGSFLGPDTHALIMPHEKSVDIDTPLDWRFAEMLLKERS